MTTQKTNSMKGECIMKIIENSNRVNDFACMYLQTLSLKSLKELSESEVKEQ